MRPWRTDSSSSGQTGPPRMAFTSSEPASKTNCDVLREPHLFQNLLQGAWLKADLSLLGQEYLPSSPSIHQSTCTENATMEDCQSMSSPQGSQSSTKASNRDCNVSLLCQRCDPHRTSSAKLSRPERGRSNAFVARRSAFGVPQLALELFIDHSPLRPGPNLHQANGLSKPNPTPCQGVRVENG